MGTKTPVAEEDDGDGEQVAGHEGGVGEKKVSEDSPEAGGEDEVNVGTETPVAEEDDGDGEQVAGHEDGLGEKKVSEDSPEAGGEDEVNVGTETPVAEDGSVAVGGDQKTTPAGGESSSPKGAGRDESGEAKEAANQFLLFGEDEEEQRRPKLPCRMGKLKKGSKAVRSNPSPVEVSTEEEYRKRRKDGWVVIES